VHANLTPDAIFINAKVGKLPPPSLAPFTDDRDSQTGRFQA
jgi:hypothetical protein